MRLQWREGMSGQPEASATKVMPMAPPARAPIVPTPPALAAAAPAEGPAKFLIVGPDINLAGEISACDRLVVEGSVQVTLNRTRAIEIAETGRFTNGKAEVEDAEIAGVYEGSLTVRKRLLIRATGRVAGTVRYGELEIERGGRLAGTIERLAADEPARGGAPRPGARRGVRRPRPARTSRAPAAPARASPPPGRRPSRGRRRRGRAPHGRAAEA